MAATPDKDVSFIHSFIHSFIQSVLTSQNDRRRNVSAGAADAAAAAIMLKQESVDCNQ